MVPAFSEAILKPGRNGNFRSNESGARGVSLPCSRYKERRPQTFWRRRDERVLGKITCLKDQLQGVTFRQVELDSRLTQVSERPVNSTNQRPGGSRTARMFIRVFVAAKEETFDGILGFFHSGVLPRLPSIKGF